MQVLFLTVRYDVNLSCFQHHPRIAINDHVVHVNACTIQAWPQSVVPIPERIKPGITLRDIRLAILIERYFTESYETAGHGSPVYAGLTQPLEPRAIGETVMATIRKCHSRQKTKKRPTRPFRGRDCTICKQNGHHMLNCPERFTKDAESPCPMCGGTHWKINCPLLRPPAPVLPVP
jgi:hypothetical protein